jgi:hypothetical protein
MASMTVPARRVVSLFLAASAGIALTAGCDPREPGGPSTQGMAGHSGAMHADGGEGGEGGEGAQGAGFGVSTPVGYATTLQLMRGHLAAGRELLARGMAAEAQPHIAHPIDELYGDLEPEFQRRGARPFLDQLNELKTRLQAAPAAPETTAALEAVEASIEQAMAGVPPQQREDPAFVVAVIRELIRTAAEEYDAAVAGDRFVELLEYQDSHGFLLVAEQLLEPIAPALKRTNPEQAAMLQKALAELKPAWPSVLPPAKPVLTPSQVTALALGV